MRENSLQDFRVLVLHALFKCCLRHLLTEYIITEEQAKDLRLVHPLLNQLSNRPGCFFYWKGALQFEVQVDKRMHLMVHNCINDGR